MENAEFMLHMKIIKDMLKHKNVRIILLHNPYNKDQQVIIDAISRNSSQIIGQVKRDNPTSKISSEIKKLIIAHSEPFVAKNMLKYVILGQQKPKISN